MLNMITKLKSNIFIFIQNQKKDDRSFQIYKSLFFSLVAQFGNILISLLLVPITLGYLDKDRYGIWLTLISIISWVYLLDVGLGNGLRNKLTESIASNDTVQAKGYITTTYFFLGIFSIIMLIILLPSCYYINWNHFLNVKHVNKDELLYTVIILLSFFSFHFFLKLIGTVYLALQKPYVTQYLTLIINIVNLMVLFVIKSIYIQSLKPIAILLGASQLIVYSMFTIYSFKGPLKKFCPEWNLIKKQYVRPLFSMGIKFFVIQITGVIMFTSSNIIISKFSEPSYVVEYNLANKYLSVSNLIFAFILMPYWSAFTDAFARMDYPWIDNSLKKLNKLWLFTSFLIIIMIIISPFFYHIWLGDKTNITFVVTLFTGFYFMSMNSSSIYNSLLSGIGKINFNFILAIAQLILFYPLILGFQYFFNKITISILSTMILNMIISSVLLRNQYRIIRNKLRE